MDQAASSIGAHLASAKPAACGLVQAHLERANQALDRLLPPEQLVSLLIARPVR